MGGGFTLGVAALLSVWLGGVTEPLDVRSEPRSVDPIVPVAEGVVAATDALDIVATPTPRVVQPSTPTPVQKVSPTPVVEVVKPTPTPAPVVNAPEGDSAVRELTRLYDEGPDAAAAALADPVQLDQMLRSLSEGGRSKDAEVREMATAVSATLWGEVRRLGPAKKEGLAERLAQGQRLERFAGLPEVVEAGGAIGLAPFLVDEVASRAPATAADVGQCRTFRRLLRQVSGELTPDLAWLGTACTVCADGGAPLTGYCPAAGG
jgi:hypothetical protein